ncbi:MAG: chromosome segregation protein SMC [Gammaproteobacteria bacterium]|nr:chromosome segregation protein SMC [Gammaproteobacteria bacterium]MBU1556199.1 chromosome segregation protein SMC [Gammaproteobacteria bacterium]MBU2070648.1 chromosome segregation protein SMC [Gammaproteobacteria bacterium]MBU2182130.1 chromosome segregation protein SMC [Gammaproteobacteria bacterium]MBU2207017.1 chromosome segregation protein SMC [Gammaproteobacteria bacterium]
MRLKQIKLSGFKSFVDSTTVPFPQQMTAVVGPNGCGKSNVIDAVRWVLGESSAKNLRGDAMTDVIFNGSAQRKPVSQASVELVFENTEGRIAGGLADRSEIAIKRIVTRDAQSLYFLNGSKCRRRDITDIFLGTGLGPRSYAIIEQGMISRLIESKPQELRVFIEEAAGISKYKERRRETENRIKHTRENLDRLADVRDELGKNIDKLKRQASAAQRYKELKAQERKLKAELTTIKWLQYNNRFTALEQQLQQQQTELEKYQSQELGDQRVLLELKQQAQDTRQQLEQAQSRFYQLGASISRLEQQILHQRQQQQSLTTQLTQAEHSLSQAQQYIAAEQAQQQELQQQLAEDEPQLELMQQQVEELAMQLQQLEDEQQRQQQALMQWQQQQFRLQQQAQQQQLQLQNEQQQWQQQGAAQQLLQQELNELALSPLRHKQQQLSAELVDCEQALAQQQQQYEQLQQQINLQQQQLTALNNPLQSLNTELQLLQREQQQLLRLQQQQASEQQQLLQQLQVQPGWATAVVLVLGQLQHASVQDKPDDMAQTRVSPNKQQPKPDSLAAKITTGIYPDYFNQVRCADNADDARMQVSTLAEGQSVITPQGYWLGSNWAVLAGSASADSYLQRAERLQALTAELAVAEDNHARAEAEYLAAQQQLAVLEQQQQQQLQQLQQRQQQLQQAQTATLLAEQELQQAQKLSQKLQAELDQRELEQAQRHERMEQLTMALEHSSEQLLQHEAGQHELQHQSGNQQQQLQQLKARYEQQRSAQQQLLMQHKMAQQQLATLTQSLGRSQQQQQQLQEQVSQLNAKLAQDDEPELLLHEQLQESLLSREEAEQTLIGQQDALANIEQQMRQLEQGQQGIMQLLNKKRAALSELQLDAEGYRVRANNMLELLREQQANMKDVLAELPADADEALWQQQLDKTTDAVARLGPINLAAIEEYEQQSERKQYLDAQNDDLMAAMETLETAIRKIDKETRQKFKDTFEQVNEGLKTLFPKVFGGGSAYLDLTEDDLLETGVTIMARPPGKKNSTIHLLSGGEKALTALSLVFSIFRLNPAPFCMLDEVDAPLDDANVGRFCNLVREMSETVQFIYISHNKIAMEMAAQLMGVTMQEPGVSRVVAVDVDDAVKMAAAS